MKLKLYAVWDSKVAAYMTPFFMSARGQALRAWDGAVNEAGSNVHKYPADFTLMEIGEFDALSGEVEGYPAPISLGNGLEFVKTPQSITPRAATALGGE